jgi:hypothetical protein
MRKCDRRTMCVCCGWAILLSCSGWATCVSVPRQSGKPVCPEMARTICGRECHLHRKKITVPDQPENEKQQSETVTSRGLREFLLDELDASKQMIAELSDEQLEEIVGGGLSAFTKKFLGCFACGGKPQTSEPVEWPTISTGVYGPLGYAIGTNTIHTPGTGAGTGAGNKTWKPGLEAIPENKRIK